MTIRILNRLCAAFAALAFSLAAFAADSAAVTTIKLAQEQLHHEGFYTGRIDGALVGATQAALAQFQLSRGIPASGSLDAATMAALRIQLVRDEPQLATTGASAAAGGSGPAPAPAAPEKKGE